MNGQKHLWKSLYEQTEIFITDVFTSQRYGGNQLATFVDCESLCDREMQQIAKEINFSETTFITSRQSRDGGYDVRIFTPNVEVEFAGHPTLGTAHIIRNKLHLSEADEITLNLPIGRISVTFEQVPSGAPMLWMKQAAPKFGRQLDVNTMAQVLSIEPSDIDGDFPIAEVSTGFPTIVVPLKNRGALKRVQINRQQYFALVSDAWAKLILVFCREGYEPGQSLSVRVFCDYYGIPEDAATGSSNGSLAAYLAHHRLLGSSSIDVTAGQGYEMGRPSTLALRTRDTQGEIAVFVGGSVVDVADGVWSHALDLRNEKN